MYFTYNYNNGGVQKPFLYSIVAFVSIVKGVSVVEHHTTNIARETVAKAARMRTISPCIPLGLEKFAFVRYRGIGSGGSLIASISFHCSFGHISRLDLVRLECACETPRCVVYILSLIHI